MARKQRITIAISPDVLSRVDRLAKAQAVSRSALLQRFVLDQLDEEELAVKAFQHPAVGPALAKAFGNMEFLRAFAGLMGQELTDEQMKLFQQGLESVTASGEDEG